MSENSRPTFSQTIGTYKGEFKKIVWPTRPELFKQSITVMITCIIIAAIIFGMDYALNWLVMQFAYLVGAL